MIRLLVWSVKFFKNKKLFFFPDKVHMGRVGAGVGLGLGSGLELV